MDYSSRLTNRQGLKIKPIFTKLCPAWLAWLARSFKFVVGPLNRLQWCLWYVFTFLLTLGVLYYIRALTKVQLESTTTVSCAIGATLCSYCLDKVVLWTTFESTLHNIMLWIIIYTVYLIGVMNKDQRRFIESQCACSNATKGT